MRNRQLLNLEYSNIDDVDKVIGISKQMGAYDQIRDMVYRTVETHNTLRQHMGVPLTPVLMLNEHMFAGNVIKTTELDNLRIDYEYIVNAFDMLKRFSH